MNNISRKKKHFLTHKKAKIRIDHLWPRYLLIILLSFSLSFLLSYKLYQGGKITGFLLRIAELESINSEIDQSMREKVLQIQMESKSYDKLSQELKVVRQENTELKEDVLFYEKIVGKRPK
tara:strand:- start:13375 stop:13737 length:363 start_codon:yes stop_codon:yes gene_type:complete